MKMSKEIKLPIFLMILALTALLLVSYKVNKEREFQCLESNTWVDKLHRNQWHAYSQLGEDGVIDSIFDNIGTTNKIYVEFGVEDCTRCNTRFLRENGWDVNNSLLMDGGHSNEAINLHQVLFWPSNILNHFTKFKVPTKFDLLSVDTDGYDWFMIETILEAGYMPRVIVTEFNGNFGIEDAKSILPPPDKKSWKRWDGTTYHGSSILALSYLFNRFSYSLIYCNNAINCFAVRDDSLDTCIRRPIKSIFFQNRPGQGHRCDYSNRSMAIIDPTGFWTGKDDGGEGSPAIRHTGCAPGVRKKKPYIEDHTQATDPARI